jgi:hypothetical protein
MQTTDDVFGISVSTIPNPMNPDERGKSEGSARTCRCSDGKRREHPRFDGKEVVVTVMGRRGLDPAAPTDGLTVGPSPGRGRGVFAARNFSEGEVIERSPVLSFDENQRRLIDATALVNYRYRWVAPPNVIGLPLGYGLLYNHSRMPNAVVIRDVDQDFVDFVALRAIARGEEITHNYSIEDPTPMWFEPGGAVPDGRPLVLLGGLRTAALGVAGLVRKLTAPRSRR